MAPSPEQPSRSPWILIAAAGLVFGSVLGYVLGTSGRTTPSPAPPPSSAVAPAPASPATASAASPDSVDEKQLQSYRDALRLDPKNLEANTQAANLLYDARRYAEAVPFYRQAFALDPTNVNLGTDLGTALWYTGQADEALAQYARSLAIDPTHAQTLFNMGIVQMDGKKDARAAVQTWEKLLKTHPDYEGAAKARERIAEARLQIK
jgi:tetratricopeptide (TPR) repeat protein